MIKYKTIRTTTKNKEAEVFYRLAVNKQLQKFIEKSIIEIKKHYTIIKGTNNSVNDVIKTINKIKKYWEPILLNNTEKIALKWFKKAFKRQSTFANKKLQEVYKSIQLSNIKDRRFLNILKLTINNNVALIKDTTEQTINNIQSIVYSAMTNGKGWEDIENNLYQQKEISYNRIKRIARDQTAKATENINRQQQQEAGIEYFIWSTSKDERVSKQHRQLEGNIYKYNETIEERLPIIDSYGNRGYPSERVNCRCTALALILNDGYKVVYKNNKYQVVKI